MIKTRVRFKFGPYDGWEVENDSNFKQHYYARIQGNRFHYYEKVGDEYLYRGEVMVG